jgi:hypothetical protein
MRRANDSKFWIEDGVLIGLNLGADFTAEHEWGIKGIKKLFGIAPKDTDFGLIRSMITNVPADSIFGWTKGNMPESQGFYLLDTWNGKIPDFSKEGELRTYSFRGNAHTLACAWDETSFGVFSSDPAEIAQLQTIFDAFRNGDGAIFLGGARGIIGNAGLVLCIASKIPASVTKAWEEADSESYRMEQEVVKSGIRDLLKAKGKRYSALSRPHHREKDGKLTFWLNPMEQQDNNYGYFTIDDLKEWAEGKGKIPRTKQR